MDGAMLTVQLLPEGFHSVHMFARVVKVSGENNGIQSAKVKPSRTTAARRKRKIQRRILSDHGLKGSEPTVNVVCRFCGGHLVTAAHPGRMWSVVRDLAPLAALGDFDQVGSRIAESGRAGLNTFDVSHSDRLPRGLWVRSITEVLAGQFPKRWDSAQSYHKRNGGDAVDFCVFGLPVVIDHICNDDDKLKPRASRLKPRERRIPFEVTDLVADVERAILDGKSKVAL